MNSHDIASVVSVDPNIDDVLAQMDPKVLLAVDFSTDKKYSLLAKPNNINIAFFSMTADESDEMEPLLAESAHDRIIVRTLGKDGSIALYQGQKYYQPIIMCERVVDTTGCGDAYHGAFVATWFATHQVETAMLAGATAAADVIKRFGGR